MLFVENGFHSRENIIYLENFLLYQEKIFIFRKKCDICRKYFWYVRKIFLRCTPPPLSVANISGEKNLDALFYWKSAPQSLPPPQLLEASYSPERIYFVLWRKIAEIRISEISKNCSFKPY